MANNDDFEKFLKQIGIDTSTLAKTTNGSLADALKNGLPPRGGSGVIPRPPIKNPPPGISPDWWDEQMKMQRQTAEAELQARRQQLADKQKADLAAFQKRIDSLNNTYNNLPRGYKPTPTPQAPRQVIPRGPSLFTILKQFTIKHKDDIAVVTTLAVVLGVALYYLL